jgi:hypothetical protein
MFWSADTVGLNYVSYIMLHGVLKHGEVVMHYGRAQHSSYLYDVSLGDEFFESRWVGSSECYYHLNIEKDGGGGEW